MSNINLEAYNKLSAAFNYAQAIDNNPTGGGSVVIHLHDGEKLVTFNLHTESLLDMSAIGA